MPQLMKGPLKPSQAISKTGITMAINQHSRADSPFYTPPAQDTSEGEGEGTAKPGWKLILTAREKGKGKWFRSRTGKEVAI